MREGIVFPRRQAEAFAHLTALVRGEFRDIERSRRNCQHKHLRVITNPGTEIGDTAIEGARYAICENRHCQKIVEVLE